MQCEYRFNGRGRMKMMKTAEQLIRNAKSRIQEVSVNELFEAMQNHKTILLMFGNQMNSKQQR